jgi:hypothetical protein
VTIVSESSPYCGQPGRVRRVFWRKRRPWVLIRFRIGGITSVPLDWTDLPIPDLGLGADNGPVVLLSPAALRDLVRFSRSHRTHGKKHLSE